MVAVSLTIRHRLRRDFGALLMQTTRLILRMALFVLLGAPLVWVVWEAVNSLLSGHPGEVRWVLAIPAALLLAGLLMWLGRSTPKMEDSRAD